MKTRLERFESKYQKGSISECWVWEASKYTSGYGQFMWQAEWPRRPNISASRAAYLLYVGPITDPKLDVCHRCDNRACVNPAHLFLGSRSENLLDCVRKGRHKRVGLQGERHGRANLTDEVVRQIRAANGSHAELEKRFRVPRTTIYNVRKHVTWRHLS